MDNVKVPKENILGKPGNGAKIVFSSLNQTRLSAAVGAVGLSQAFLDQLHRTSWGIAELSGNLGVFGVRLIFVLRSPFQRALKKCLFLKLRPVSFLLIKFGPNCF